MEHFPALPGNAHDLHVADGPKQGTSQQNPCSHRFDPHSPAITQVAPSGFLPQLVPVQVFPAVQSALPLAALHTDRQLPPVPH